MTRFPTSLSLAISIAALLPFSPGCEDNEHAVPSDLVAENERILDDFAYMLNAEPGTAEASGLLDVVLDNWEPDFVWFDAYNNQFNLTARGREELATAADMMMPIAQYLEWETLDSSSYQAGCVPESSSVACVPYPDPEVVWLGPGVAQVTTHHREVVEFNGEKLTNEFMMSITYHRADGRWRGAQMISAGFTLSDI